MPESVSIFAIDHIVLTVRDIDTTCAWYERVLGMRRVEFDGGYMALQFGLQKINVHPAEAPFAPHATIAQPGTADICFVATRTIEEIVAALNREDVAIESGPVEQTGASGVMDSVYVRDPDGNLVEIASYR
jgi:catechol 2,3-dioxygenase-like lactoylglutathione lyase family enzyme